VIVGQEERVGERNGNSRNAVDGPKSARI